MRRTTAGLMSLALASGIGVTLSSQTAFAAAPIDGGPSSTSAKRAAPDALPNPLDEKRQALRSEAITRVINGEAAPQNINGSTVVKLGKAAGGSASDVARAKVTGQKTGANKDQYVELKRESTDRIFVILAEFGNQRSPNYPDQDTDPDTPGPTVFDGPLHNKIPEPDRSVDNSTVWQQDYSAEHYRQLYFGTGAGVESLKTYYQKQSSGRYSVNGEVTDWVKVPYNEARYGRSDGYPCASNVCSNTWALVRDAANQWVADQKAAGRTDAQVAADMKSFDKWDRYDFDGDGNFNEPDGYIDHFQIVHAGGDQADGDPSQGEDAIWSHRWYAYGTDAGSTGPAQNLLGGTQIGTTGIWIGDYTIQPENGGLSVFAHEYGHDLGLPDDYDTATGGGSPTEWWTLMSQSRLNAAGEALGERPGDIGAWQKLQLGWLDYQVAVKGNNTTIDLGPQEYNSDKAQAVVVPLPKKSVTTQLGAPFAGTKQYFSGNADDLDNTMTKELDFTGKTSASLTMKARYAIETDYDYLYFEASLDGGSTWVRLDGTVGGRPLPKDSSGAPALTGSSNGAWVDVNIPMDAAAGKKVLYRYHYKTDGGVSEGGFFGDNIVIKADGATVLEDGAETPTTWTLKGFSVVGATSTKDFDNYYIAGHRSYVSYDRYLKTGPYNFGFANTKPDFVEHFAYQQGLLISYWDTSQVDNNVSQHPGLGRNLYIDSRPQTLYRLDGTPWRTRIQIYDAPFSLTKGDSFTLHFNGQASYIRGVAGNPLFDDTKNYFDTNQPEHGVKLPATGVKIRVLSEDGTSMRIRVS